MGKESPDYHPYFQVPVCYTQPY